jgi:hypothetical protein
MSHPIRLICLIIARQVAADDNLKRLCSGRGSLNWPSSLASDNGHMDFEAFCSLISSLLVDKMRVVRPDNDFRL